MDVQYDYELIGRRISPQSLAANRDYTIWRYRPLLPVEPDSPVPPLTVGWTPLYRADRLAAGLGLKHVWVKDDGRQPSASFKDRASAIAVVKAASAGRRGHHHRQHGQRRRGAVGAVRQRGADATSSSCPSRRRRPRSHSCWSTAAR